MNTGLPAYLKASLAWITGLEMKHQKKRNCTDTVLRTSLMRTDVRCAVVPLRSVLFLICRTNHLERSLT
jgi:hypothetical protein